MDKTIGQLQVRKKYIEEEIKTLLDEFQREFGVSVYTVDLQTSNFCNDYGLSEYYINSVKLNLNL